DRNKKENSFNYTPYDERAHVQMHRTLYEEGWLMSPTDLYPSGNVSRQRATSYVQASSRTNYDKFFKDECTGCRLTESMAASDDASKTKGTLGGSGNRDFLPGVS
ncbi:hypothetical protein FOZ62_032041, partial [Perkinsus olseni]